MLRRIELIWEFPLSERHEDLRDRFFKSGLCGLTTEEIVDAWEGLPAPKQRIPENCRFYFTEAGWEMFGRAVVAACQLSEKKYNIRYRVVCIKENDVDVVYRDEWQVAGQPKRKWRKDKVRRKRYY